MNKKAIVYRGVKDVLISRIDHLYGGWGTFGDGTYFSLDWDVAEGYSEGESWGIVLKYELYSSNPLVLHSPKDIDLNPNSMTEIAEIKNKKLWKTFSSLEGKVTAQNISRHAALAGHDAIFMNGDVNGGEQILIPLDKTPAVTPVSFDLVVMDSKAAKAIEKVLEIKPQKRYGDFIFTDIPVSKAVLVDGILGEL